MNESAVSSLLKKKREVKKSLCKDLKLSYKKPLLAVILDKDLLKEDKGKIDFFLNGSDALDMEIVVLADFSLKGHKNGKVKFIPYNRQNRKVVLEAADTALCFKFSDVEEMLLNGVIPVSLNRKEIKDYNPNEESGNSFIYKTWDPWHVFAALVRAQETFKFPYDWKHIVREGLSSVCDEK